MFGDLLVWVLGLLVCFLQVLYFGIIAVFVGRCLWFCGFAYLLARFPVSWVWLLSFGFLCGLFGYLLLFCMHYVAFGVVLGVHSLSLVWGLRLLPSLF